MKRRDEGGGAREKKGKGKVRKEKEIRVTGD